MEWWQWIGPVSALVLGVRTALDAVRDWREGETLGTIGEESSLAFLMLVISFVATDPLGIALISSLSLLCAFMPERWRHEPVPLLDRWIRKKELPDPDGERVKD